MSEDGAGNCGWRTCQKAQARAELARLADLIARGPIRPITARTRPLIPRMMPPMMRCAKRNTAIEARFPALIRPDSPSGRIGTAPADGFRQDPSPRGAMMSLANGFTPDDVADFVTRNSPVFWVWQRTHRSPLLLNQRLTGCHCPCAMRTAYCAMPRTRGDGETGRGCDRECPRNRGYSANACQCAQHCWRCAAKFTWHMMISPPLNETVRLRKVANPSPIRAPQWRPPGSAAPA